MPLRRLAPANPFSPREGLLYPARSSVVVMERPNEDVGESSWTSSLDLRQFLVDLQLRGELEDELAAARLTIEELKRHASPPCTIRNHAAILQATAELFPAGQVTVTVESDPESGDEEFFAINVATPGDVNDLVARHSQWHSRKREVAPETASSYRLLLDIQ
jgi:hypothetical protein